MNVGWFPLKVIVIRSDVWASIISPSLSLPLCLPVSLSLNFSSLVSLSNRKSSTVPDSVAMMMLARKRPSPVIQVTVKQTETDPGLIGVVSPNKKKAGHLPTWKRRPTLCPDFNHVSLNSLPRRTARSRRRRRRQWKVILIFLWVWLRGRWVTNKGKMWINEQRNN